MAHFAWQIHTRSDVSIGGDPSGVAVEVALKETVAPEHNDRGPVIVTIRDDAHPDEVRDRLYRIVDYLNAHNGGVSREDRELAVVLGVDSTSGS